MEGQRFESVRELIYPDPCLTAVDDMGCEIDEAEVAAGVAVRIAWLSPERHPAPTHRHADASDGSHDRGPDDPVERP
jgi:hypothetical protein